MIYPVELVYPKICLWINEGGPQCRQGATSLRRWSPNLAGDELVLQAVADTV